MFERFPQSSRYHGLGTRRMKSRDGADVVYLERRLIPLPPRRVRFLEHTVDENDRLDRVTHQYLRDPHAYWRICDLNAALHPDALTSEPGRRVRIGEDAAAGGFAGA